MKCDFGAHPLPEPPKLAPLTGNGHSPCSSHGKESSCNAEDLGSIPGLGRSSGEGNGYPLQYSCLENPMDLGEGAISSASAGGLAIPSFKVWGMISVTQRRRTIIPDCLTTQPLPLFLLSYGDDGILKSFFLMDDSLLKKSYDKPRQCIKKQRHHFANKGLSSQSYGFSCSHG